MKSDERATKLILALVLLLWAGSGVAGVVERGYFGLIPELTAQGVEIRGVAAGGPADLAGIREGDLLVLLGGEPLPVTSLSDVRQALQRFSEGDVVEIVLRREGQAHRVEVALSAVPERDRETQQRLEERRRVREERQRVFTETFRGGNRVELAIGPGDTVKYRADTEGSWTEAVPGVVEIFAPLVAQLRTNGRKRGTFLVVQLDDGALRIKLLEP